jgi:hypothetical protein
VDDVKSQNGRLTRVYVELDNKISDKGGVQKLFEFPSGASSLWVRGLRYPCCGRSRCWSRLNNSPTHPTSIGIPSR